MKNIVVYGSLKKGKYNHSMIAGAEYLGPTKVKGTLYSLGSFPALVAGGENEYEAEIYSVTDEQYNAVKSMELGSGYDEYEVDAVGENGEKITAAVYYADSGLSAWCRERCVEIGSY